ncbi:MAG: TlyA family RNA methyltransferase [Flavobacteriaceae bacterium]
MRLDEELVRRGLSPSRSRARDSILRGAVSVDGAPARKPSQTVSGASEIALADPAGRYVARSALKLAAALDAFGYDPAMRVALDVGASTGGFTQVLLERGAARVFAVDVGHGQLHESLARDPRIVAVEGVNARDLTAEEVPEAVGFVAIDVSFISQRLVLPAVLALAAPGALLVSLVKPQFEVGREAVGKGGIVRDAAAARASVEAVADAVRGLGWTVDGVIASPIPGGDGNAEYLLGARHG